MPTPSPYTAEELMETFKQISSKMKADIRVEFEAGRIAGNQYAEVYLGMLTAALQGASQFYLTKDSAWAQYALQEAEIKRVEAQTLLLGEELLQAKVTTSIATETKDEQVQLTEQQLLQATEQVKGLQEQLLQSKVQTEISTATKADQIAIVSNQLEQGIKQLGMMDSQMKTAAEQLTQAKIQTEITTATKDEQIALAEVQLKQQEDALAVSQERHGMNFKPAFTQE